MKAIREDREITLEAIARETKAAGNVLEEFEQTALVGNPMYNRVYLRLFMRGYAEVVGVRTDDALRAADEMLAGQYTDRLRRLYLDDEPLAGDAGGGAAAAGGPSGVAPAGPPPNVPSQPSTPGAGMTGPSDSSKTAGSNLSKPAGSDASKTTPDRSPTKEPEPQAEKPATTASGSKTEKPRPADKALSASRGSGSSTASGKGGQSKTSQPTSSDGSPGGLLLNSQSLVRWAGGVIGVVIVALATWYFWPDATEPPPPPVQVTPPDTTQLTATLPPRIILGDTTSFFVIAARDTLNPIRITVDGGIRAPYWIEYLDSLELRVSQDLVLEQRLNAVDVSVRDILLPTDGRDAENRLVLSKEMAQAFLDSLRTAGGYPVGGVPND